MADKQTMEAAQIDVLADEYGPGARRFKVGDRVRNPNVPEAGIGIIEEVRAGGYYLVNYKDTWFGRCADTDETLDAASLTIETGKFYRTRDGRKVGPMRWVRPRLGKFCFVDETDAAWAVDGAFDIGGNPSERDLIAEWVDDPASNDNAPATKPAIVALIENGQPKPSEKPKVHISEESATDEAERLAVKYPGQKFGVFVLADSRIADVVIRRAA